ncbi:MAG: ChaN family lipoprotein [Candidatus Brocadiia bacterium]
MKAIKLLSVLCGLGLIFVFNTHCGSAPTVAEAKSLPVTEVKVEQPSAPAPADKTGDNQMEVLKQNAKKSLELLQKMSYPELYTKYLDLKTKEVIDFETMISRLKGIQAVYVAESHTTVAHHDLQLKVLKRMRELNPKTALAMEFLYRSKQQITDDYMNGKISDEEFDTKSVDGFGVYYKYYIDMLRYAKVNNIKTVGLNVEKPLKQKMANMGWDKLTPEEQKLIAKDIDTSNEDHRKFVMDKFKGMMNAMGPIKNNSMLDRFYLMQCIWDETFSETIANHLKAANDKDAQVMIVLGSGHVDYKFNTPDRAYKRYQVPFRTIVPVETNKFNLVDYSELLFSTIGDFAYFSDMPKGE